LACGVIVVGTASYLGGAAGGALGESMGEFSAEFIYGKN
jgi:hypothetical protein